MTKDKWAFNNPDKARAAQKKYYDNNRSEILKKHRDGTYKRLKTTSTMQVSEDDRRELITFPDAKLMTAKKDCAVGGHYHKKKTEFFILISGEGLLNGKQMRVGKLYKIVPLKFHEFLLKKGSVLIGLNSKTYNPRDDYR